MKKGKPIVAFVASVLMGMLIVSFLNLPTVSASPNPDPPNPPTALLCEELTNPTHIIDSMPEFSAIGTDNDEDNIGYYALQVDDDSGFGSLIYNKTKTAITPFENGTRCEDVSYENTDLIKGTTYYWKIKFWDVWSDEQSAANEELYLWSGHRIRGAQRKTISNRYITKLGFWLYKTGSPTGDITFTIRKVSDDSIIVSKVWGDASALTYGGQYYEVTFDAPTLVNEEVRLCVEFSGGDASNFVRILSYTPSVKPGEWESAYLTSWTEFTEYDVAYKVTSELEGDWSTETATFKINRLPTAPTGWTDLGMNLVDHTPTITWTKGTDADGDTVTTYVYVGTTSTPTTVETSTTVQTADLGSTVTLSDEVTYWYRLRSWDGYEWSDYTTADQFRMNSKPSNPTSWTDLGTHLTDHTPTVTWSGQSDAEDDTITVYVYVGITSTPTAEEGNSTTETLDLGSTVTLNDGTTYYYRLRAYDGYEWNDSYTTSDEFRMNTPPTIPANSTDLSLREIDHTPDVSWDNSTDAESDSVTYWVETSADGVTFYADWSSADNSCTLDYYTFEDGENYWWRVRAYDEYEYSDWAPSAAGDEFQFNQIPTVAPVVTPSNPGGSDNLVCAPNGNDPDGDDMTYTYQWYENDVLMSGQTDNVLEYTHTVVDNVYLCEVTPHDGYEYGAAENSNEVVIGNNPPTKPTNWTDLGMHLVDHTPTITWTKGTDEDEDPVTTYVYVGITPTPTTLETSTAGETADLGSTVTLTDGVTYYYRLRSYDTKVFSGYTEADEFRMNAPPSVPTGINDLGTNLIDHTPDKTFTKGTDSDGDTVYTIAYLGTSSNPTEEDVSGTGTSLTLGENASHSCYPLVDGQTYFVRLRSWDGYEYSAYTSDDEFRMNTPPTIPTNFTDLSMELTTHTPTIYWTKGTDAEGDTVWTYIYVGTTSTPTAEEGYTEEITTKLGVNIPLTLGISYYYRLRSWDGHEWSDNTTADQFKVSPPLHPPRSPIYIDGNDQFTADMGVNGGGSGTEGDPYIIENWAIDTTSGSFGISIWNTTAHFIVRNCSVEDGDEMVVGIYLWNVENGRIENNICKGSNAFGIRLDYSHHCHLIGNLSSNNTDTGIFLYWSDVCTLTHNTSSRNDYGILLHNTGTNTIHHNYLLNNTVNNAHDEYGTGNIWDNGSEGNIWDDWQTPDDDDDGIVDNPRPISGGDSEDRYPLVIGWPFPPPLVPPYTIVLVLLVCMTIAFAYLYFKVAKVRDLISGGEAIKGVFIFLIAMIIMWVIAYGLITSL